MNLKTLLRAGGATALIGAMALTALPLSAQEENGRGRRHADSAEQAQERQQARAERQAQRAEAVSQRHEQRQSQAPVAQVQSQPAREWSRGDRRSDTGAESAGREWNRRDNASNDWGQARAAQAQAEAQARYQARAQADAGQWRGRGQRGAEASSTAGRWERNRSYGDRNRNSTYRDGYRDGRQSDWRQDRAQQQNAYRSGYRDGYRSDNRYAGSDYGTNHRRWNHDWRRDSRYNWYSYRNQYRDRYRLGRYYSPYSNYRYSRLSIGFRLGSSFYGSRYWINDPWQYRLPAAYGPYRWVRYYDDALLVDIYTGEVVDVIYDFFW
jgi:hypothetical protein